MEGKEDDGNNKVLSNLLIFFVLFVFIAIFMKVLFF
jgi:hypothetical protein